ncbi:MAG TPA: ABC transporter permease [Bacteroidales bacterium]|nr:ABC transporter permease [Bacteroidales bacterium]
MKGIITNSYRSIINQRPYSIINIIGLTIGLGAVILILLWIKAETGYDRFHPDHENIYRVNHLFRTPNRVMDMGGINAPAGPEFKERFPSIEEYVRCTAGQSHVKYKDDFYALDMMYADTNFFSMFNFPLLSGNKSSCLSAPDRVVLTRSAATKIFGTKYPVGEVISINNNDYVVSAIANDPPLNSSIKFEAVCLMSVLEARSHVSWDGGLRCQTFLRLSEGADTEKLLEDISDYLYDVINERFLKHGFEIVPYLQQMKYIHLGSTTDFDFSGLGSWKRIISFSFVGLLILMTACFNFVNISTALSMQRSKEVSVRKIYGSGRKRLVLYFIFESGLSILISIILALLLVKATLSYFNVLVGSEISFSLLSSFEWGLMLLLLWLLCVFLASFYSAWYLSAIPPMAILRKERGGRRRQLSRNILVTFQFAISICLVISCLVIYSQMRFVRKTDPGFEPENVMMIVLKKEAAERVDIIKGRLEKVSGIKSVTCSAGGIPGLNFTSNGYTVQGMEKPLLANAVYVDKDYLETTGIRVEKGRNFRDSRGDLNNVLVNETFLASAGWEEGIGKIISRNGTEYRVIGIVEDFFTSSLHNKIQPLFISLKNEWGEYNIVLLKLEHKPDENLKFRIEKIFTEEDPGNPLNYNMLEDSLGEQYKAEKNLNLIFFILSLLAILISALGLFGLATFSTQVRKKEIGIRKVNGAMIKDIVRRFSSELLLWIFIAFVIAAPVSYIIMKGWLTNFEYKAGISAWIVIGGGLLAMLVGLLSIGFATLKEAGRNPAETLRFE